MNDSTALQRWFRFLSQVWNQSRHEELGLLLSDIEPLKDGGPADRAMLGDWEKARIQITSASEYTSDQAYAAGLAFTRNYVTSLNWRDKDEFIAKFSIAGDGGPADPRLKSLWIGAE